MDIELLQGNLPISESPGLDSTDPRLDEIATLSQAGNHAEAAARSEEILAEGIYDIRLICFFLYGYWLESGLASLLILIECLNSLLRDNWQALGPLNNPRVHSEKSLDWLFRQLFKKIQYEENKKTPLWREWQGEALDADRIPVAGSAFREALNLRLDDKAGALIAQWSKIEQWLQTFQILTNPSAETGPDRTDDSLDGDDCATVSTSWSAFNLADINADTSYPLQLLQKKLAAFDHVVREGKFAQAALLADDINDTLANFDPKLFFPKLFENFSKLQVLYFQELIAYADQRDDPQWLAMREWLKVDIDGFINH